MPRRSNPNARRRPMRRRATNNIVGSNTTRRSSLQPVQGALPVRYNPNPEPPVVPINWIFTRRTRFFVPFDNAGNFSITAGNIAVNFRLPSMLSFNWHLCELRGPTNSAIVLTHANSGVTIADSGSQGARRAACALRACQLDQVNYLPDSTEPIFTGSVTPTSIPATDFIMDVVITVLTQTSPQTFSQTFAPPPADYAIVPNFRALSMTSPRR